MIGDKRIRRDRFASVGEFEPAADLDVGEHNVDPKRLILTALASDFPAKVALAKAAVVAASG
jgi:hypothetical protein